MIFATLNANLHGRFATWDQGTRVKVLAQDSGKAMIEREEPSRGEGRMMPLLDQMCGVPMDCLEVEKAEDEAFYCPEHRYNPPENSGMAFCPQCEFPGENTEGLELTQSHEDTKGGN